jgi:iodotyrosine deiodinase
MNILDIIKKRRSVGTFSNRPVDKDKIDRIVKSVEFSPMGSEKIPLKVVVVSKPDKKKQIRLAAEQVEKAYLQGASVFDNSNGSGSAGDDEWKKPFLEEAPYLLIICSLSGQPYQAASTWLALGNLMMAATEEGLGSLCYTPSMPTFLRKLLDLTAKYMPIAVIPVGYSADELFPKLEPKEEKMFRNIFSGRFNWQKG